MKIQELIVFILLAFLQNGAVFAAECIPVTPDSTSLGTGTQAAAFCGALASTATAVSAANMDTWIDVDVEGAYVRFFS